MRSHQRVFLEWWQYGFFLWNFFCKHLWFQMCFVGFFHKINAPVTSFVELFGGHQPFCLMIIIICNFSRISTKYRSDIRFQILGVAGNGYISWILTFLSHMLLTFISNMWIRSVRRMCISFSNIWPIFDIYFQNKS